LTLLSPCAFLANNYIVLPRLANWLDLGDAMMIRPTRVLKIFLWSDGITFFLQMSGGGMGAAAGNMAKIGE